MPGMGGVDNSRNFILNCADWLKFYNVEFLAGRAYNIDGIKVLPKHIGIAPVTGAVQNIGFPNESDFYLPYFTAAKNTGIDICVGDGAPDEKLLLGMQAVQQLGEKAYFFLKPYRDSELLRRIALVKNDAAAIGMDIDAYNIVTMRNQVKLEWKTPEQIEKFRAASGLPLMLKGIFTDADLELCRKVKPDIAVVSNHGGRIDTRIGSTAEFLRSNAQTLHSYCKEVWVDGGIRTRRDIQTALFLGADKALIARSFISAVCLGGAAKMETLIKGLLSE